MDVRRRKCRAASRAAGEPAPPLPRLPHAARGEVSSREDVMRPVRGWLA